MNFEYGFETKRINEILKLNGENITLLEFLEKEINRFLLCRKRRKMILGEEYYKGNQDILKRQRTAIGNNGEREIIENLPNNKIIDNQYARLVDQKNSYLLSKPLTFYTNEKDFLKRIRKILGKNFFRTMKNIGEDSINCGIGWLYIYINEKGKFDFKRFKPYEILPFWEDEEHTKLDMLARIYDIKKYEKNAIKTFTQVELYTKKGVQYYILDGEKLLPDYNNGFTPYLINYDKTPLHWEEIPIIPFKYNSKEIPLIQKIKTLQDALNTIRSDFMNNLQEDARNTILILKNYDGTNLGEFRKNLSEYGVVKVKTIDGNDGGVEALKIQIDNSNYEMMAKALKKAIIENARGYDSKDEKLGSNPNQMNIQSVYADIDLDAGLMEAEFQASFESLFEFIKIYIKNIYEEDYFDEEIEVIFNKDILINETEAISNCVNSVNILSKETIISQHPWVSRVDAEIERLNAESENIEKNAE